MNIQTRVVHQLTQSDVAYLAGREAARKGESQAPVANEVVGKILYSGLNHDDFMAVGRAFTAGYQAELDVLLRALLAS